MYKVHLRAGSGGGENEKWFQIQDLIVEEIRKEMIFLGETVIQVRIAASAICHRLHFAQIWERREEASPANGPSTVSHPAAAQS